MTAESNEVPGYSRNIVLVGWPEDKVPDLAPHTTKVIDAGLPSILLHASDLIRADLVVLYPCDGMLAMPTSAEKIDDLWHELFPFRLHAGEHRRRYTSILPRTSDRDSDLRKLALEVLRMLVVLDTADRATPPAVIVFLPDLFHASDSSMWREWLDLPPDEITEPRFSYTAHADTHSVSALYRRTTRGQTFRTMTDFWNDAGGWITSQRPRTVSPLVSTSGGLTAALSQILPTGSSVCIDGVNAPPPGGSSATIHPVIRSGGACFAARIQVGNRNTFLLPSISDPSAFVREAVRGLCAHAVEQGSARDKHLLNPLAISKTASRAPDHPTARAKTIQRVDPIEDCDFGISMQESGKWRIRFRLDDAHVETAEVKNTTGMRYLVALIEHPNERIYPEYLKSGYAKKHEQMVWVSEQTPAAEMAQGVKTGIDVEASTMRPRLRLTSGSATSQIERMNQELRGVVRQISDLDRAGLGIRDPAMAELIAVRKKIEKAIATMKRYREVNRHVKSVGKAISRALRLLQDQGCAELSTHLRAFIAPLEAEILSYEPPPEIRWNVFWTTNVPSRKARVRR